MKRILRKPSITSILLLILILTASISSIIIVYTIFYQETISGDENIVNIPRLFIKTIIYLNTTSNDLVKLLDRSLEKPTIPEESITKLISKLKNYTLSLKGITPLEQKLENMSINYLHIAVATRNLSRTLSLLNNTYDYMEDSLKALTKCEVDRAINIFDNISDRINSIEKHLIDAYNELSLVDNKFLGSQEHVKLKNKAMETIDEILRIISKYKELFKNIKSDRESFEKACRISMKGLNEISGMSSSDLSDLINRVNNLMNKIPYNSNNYELTDEYNELYSMLSSLVKSLENASKMKCNETSGSGGTAGGYKEVQEND